MLANADPYCAAPRHLNMTVKKMMAKKYSEQAERLRESFAARYEPTDFSDKFLTSLNHVFSKLNRQDLGDMNVVEEIISFVVRWDAERGFDGTEKMLEEARNTLLREISLKAEMRLAKIRMEVVNNGAQGFCQETRRVRDSYIQNEDLTRQDAVDRVKSHIDAATLQSVQHTRLENTGHCEAGEHEERGVSSGGHVAGVEAVREALRSSGHVRTRRRPQNWGCKRAVERHTRSLPQRERLSERCRCHVHNKEMNSQIFFF